VTTDEEWFRSQLSAPDENGCMNWTGSIDKAGYGRVQFRGKRTGAHRLAYKLLIGPIPEGLTIDHVWERGCRSRACCNPEHLEAVTNEENVRRMHLIKRQKPQPTRTHCVWNHEFTPNNVCYDPRGNRRCKTCAKLQGHSWHRNVSLAA
jgi:hypothetical protein